MDSLLLSFSINFFLDDIKFILKYQYLSVCLEGTRVSEVEAAIFNRSMKAAEYVGAFSSVTKHKGH